MTEKRAGRELLKWITLSVAMLLALYVGVYFKMVMVGIRGEAGPSPGSQSYRANRGWDVFFAPIHWFDRHLIRPDQWEVIE